MSRTRALVRRVARPSFVLVGGLHLLGWGTLLGAALPLGIAPGAAGAPGATAGEAPLATVGLGLTAYLLGMRHAFDPDHIAAIDNTTRRFVAAGRTARSVGLWFSLGHSTVVVALCVLLVAFGNAVSAIVTDDSSNVRAWTGVVGPVVSGVFLIAIAAMNVAGLRHPHRHEVRGPVMWLLGRFDRLVDRPSRMYVTGLLFGLGFDTATEVGLLVLAGTAVLGAVPWWAVLTLPLLFAAGMSMLDSMQGSLALRAYSWAPDRAASARPYTIVMTSVSALAALTIGVVELTGVASSSFDLGGPIAWMGAVEISWLGLALTAVIAVLWAVMFTRARRGIAVRES